MNDNIPLGYDSEGENIGLKDPRTKQFANLKRPADWTEEDERAWIINHFI